MQDYSAARLNMVESQLRTNKVIDEHVLAAMGQVPREKFVPATHRGVAYVDEDIPLGGGRHLMEPMVFARLLETAGVKPTDVVLDVGCGTGYSTVVLSKLADTVVALESEEGLAAQAAGLLEEMAGENTAVVRGPLDEGYAGQAPYDVIVIEGAVQEIPQALLDQLGESGRLVAVVVEGDRIGRATVVTNFSGHLGRREVFDANTPLLNEFRKEVGFVF